MATTTPPSLMCSRHPNVRMMRGGNQESNRSSLSTTRRVRHTCHVCTSENRAFREHPQSRLYANVIEEVKYFHKTPEFQILLENWRSIIIPNDDEEPQQHDEGPQQHHDESSAVESTHEHVEDRARSSDGRSSDESSSTLSFFRDDDDDIPSRTSTAPVPMDVDSANPQRHLPEHEVMTDNEHSHCCSLSEPFEQVNDLSVHPDDDEKERLRQENQLLQAELETLKAMTLRQEQSSAASLHQVTASGNSSFHSALRQPRDIVFTVDDAELNGRTTSASIPSMDSPWQQRVWAPPKTTTTTTTTASWSPFQGRDGTSTTKTSTLEITLAIPSLSPKVADHTTMTTTLPTSNMARPPAVPSHIYLPADDDSVSMLGSEWDGTYSLYGAAPSNNSNNHHHYPPSQPSSSPRVVYLGRVKPPPVVLSPSKPKSRYTQITAKDLLRKGKKAFSAVTAHLIPDSGSIYRKEDETLSITSLFGNDNKAPRHAAAAAAAANPPSSTKSHQAYFPGYQNPRPNSSGNTTHPRRQSWQGIGGTHPGMFGKDGNVGAMPNQATKLSPTAITLSFAASMKEEDEYDDDDDDDNYDDYSVSSLYTS